MAFTKHLPNLTGYILTKKLRLFFAGGVIHLKPSGRIRGNVLLSYITLPFVISDSLLDAHTNRWECREIARTFLDNGYCVDVIDWTNKTFSPKKNYDFFIDIHSNMERLSPLLNAKCVKIFHITGSHWLFQNSAEYERLLELQKRRGVTLVPRRIMPPSHAIEHANIVTMLGNDFTESTYAYAKKRIYRIPLSTTHQYESVGEKNFDAVRKNFVWFGGSGMVHKGLDLVLEAFADMPELNLTVCGKVSNEKDFDLAFGDELYRSENIRTTGLVDPGGADFQKICENSIALVYPSCSEGQSGAVITTMHAGLIPLVSYQSGVDVHNFGVIFKENSVESIRSTIREIASSPVERLRNMSIEAQKFATQNHTRETFSSSYRSFVSDLLNQK